MSWVKFGLLAALAAGGALGGLYLSGGLTTSDLPPSCPGNPPSPTPLVPSELHRIPLFSLDVKDTLEAPELVSNCCGKLSLAWASKTSETERTVFYTRSIDGKAFDEPRAISKGGIYKTAARGKMSGHERRAVPHLAAMGPEVLLTWSEALADGSGMRMVLATSTDPGATFGVPQTVHSGERANPTFTAFARGLGGVLACAWLDDRAGNQQVFASVRPLDAEVFNPERLVQSGQEGKGVCPCCPTAARFAADGTLYVAFRNINEGYRDIAVSRLRPGQSKFEGPFPVVEKIWKFDGCPHDGPSIAIIGDTMHVAWMDAHTGPQRCYIAKAKLADMKFESRELNAAGLGTQGNAKLFGDDSDNLHAVWEERDGAEPVADAHAGHQHGAPIVGGTGGRAIQYAMMPAGQSAFGAVRAIAPKTGAFQTRPSIAVTPKGIVFVAWNELDTTGKAIVVSRVSPPTEAACCEEARP